MWTFFLWVSLSISLIYCLCHILYFHNFWLNWAKSSNELFWSHFVLCLSVHLFANFSHFELLIQNQLANFNQIRHKVSQLKCEYKLQKWKASFYSKQRKPWNCKNRGCILKTSSQELLSQIQHILTKISIIKRKM